MIIVVGILVFAAIALVAFEFIAPVIESGKSKRKITESDSLGERMSGLEEKVSSLGGESVATRADYSAVEKKLQNAQAKEAELVEKIYQQKKIYEAQLNTLRQDNAGIDGIKEENEELINKITALEDDIDSFIKEKENIAKQCARLQEELDTIKTKQAELEKSAIKAKQLTDSLEEELEKTKEENTTLKDDLEYERHHE
ncbi:MAG: hypothetical protein GY858_01295 [Candidatus Omnitrophica bacterium]|nr:hypothetical protein [Candidatus Omnitrophota bacterium]